MTNLRPRHSPGPLLSSFLAAIVATCLIAPGALAESPLHGDVSNLMLRIAGGDQAAAEALTEADVVRAMYAEAQHLLEGSGYEPEIELWDFRTIGAGELDQLYFDELVTAPGGRQFRIELDYMVPREARKWVHLTAAWESPDLAERATKLDPRRVSLAEAIEALDRPGFSKRFTTAPAARSIAVTAFQVLLGVAGETRTYRAAVVWREQKDGRIVASIQDNVLTPLDFVISEAAEPTPHADYESLIETLTLTGQLETGLTLGQKGLYDNGCLATQDDDQRRQITDQDSNGHTSGNHNAIMGLFARHTCDPNCLASCTPAFWARGCGGYGSLVSGHFSHKLAVARTQKGDQRYGGATCIAAQQCQVGACTPFCPGLSVGVTILGSSVSFNNASGAIATFNMEDRSSQGCLVIPDPPSCLQTGGTIAQISIDDEAPALAVPKSGYTLRRTESSGMLHKGTPVTFLMGEWAVVSYQAFTKTSPRVDVLRTSDSAFADAKVADLSKALGTSANKAAASSGTRHSAVIVEMPVHGDNSRAISLPKLALASGRVAASSPSGRVLVRADFAEGRGLQDLDVLQDTFGGNVDQALLDSLRDELYLQYASDKSHRVIVFAVLDIDGGKLTVRRTLPYIPKCCCGGQFCE